MEVCHFVLTTPKTSRAKLTATVAEIQHLPDFEKTHPKEEFSCLKWTKYFGKTNVYVTFRTDTDKPNFVRDCFRKQLYLKEDEIDMKLKKK